MSGIQQQIALIVERYHRENADIFHPGDLAELIIAELGFHIEGRQLSDGEGGMSYNWKTGERITRPCTLQIRWATDWVKDDNMTLPLMAYVPTP